ncbi:hypothetical protein F4802DRAFT_320140 [Xylaria palmicola]|nr:hypothetical protein F4802DRAFT_320140 [Xylaria palmicola]
MQFAFASSPPRVCSLLLTSYGSLKLQSRYDFAIKYRRRPASASYLISPTSRSSPCRPSLPEAVQQIYKNWGLLVSGQNGQRHLTCIVVCEGRHITPRAFQLNLDDSETRITAAVQNCEGAAESRRDDHITAAYHIHSTATKPSGKSKFNMFVRDCKSETEMKYISHSTRRTYLFYGRSGGVK